MLTLAIGGVTEPYRRWRGLSGRPIVAHISPQPSPSWSFPTPTPAPEPACHPHATSVPLERDVAAPPPEEIVAGSFRPPIPPRSSDRFPRLRARRSRIGDTAEDDRHTSRSARAPEVPGRRYSSGAAG